MLSFPPKIKAYHNHYDGGRTRFVVSFYTFDDEGLYYGIGPTFEAAHADAMDKFSQGLSIAKINQNAREAVASRPSTLSSDLDGLDLDI